MDAGQVAELLRAAITGFYLHVAKPQCPDCICSPVINCGRHAEIVTTTDVVISPCFNSWWFSAGIAFVLLIELGGIIVWYKTSFCRPRRTAAQIALAKRHVR